MFNISVDTHIRSHSYVHTYSHTYIHTYTHSEVVELTYGKEAFDSTVTPLSQDQIPASPVLMFKAPPGTVFLSDVEISISVDKSVLLMLFGSDSDSESEFEERRKHDGGSRKLLLASATTQELKQHWFNTATMVRFRNIYHASVLL